MNHLRTYLFCGLTAGLLALITIKPWGPLNSALGIRPPLDTLRRDEPDSLFIDPLTLTLPSVGDSLALQQKAARLEELHKQDQALDAQLKEKQRAIQKKQQSLVSMTEIDRLLVKQNGKGRKQDASHLAVSDLETELNQRSGSRP